MIAESKLNRRVFGLVVLLVMAFAVAFVSSPVRGRAENEKAPEPGQADAQAVDIPFADAGAAGYGVIRDPGQHVAVEKMAVSADNKSNAAPAERRTSLNFTGTAKVKVDPRKHCLYIGIPPYEGCENGTLRIDLDKGVTYTIRCSGEAFMSTETGEFADPYPGIFFAYQTDQQDCHEICNTILKPGDTITFTTPTCIGEDEDVFAITFFMQAWKHAYWPAQRGGYTLTFTRTAGDSTTISRYGPAIHLQSGGDDALPSALWAPIVSDQLRRQ